MYEIKNAKGETIGTVSDRYSVVCVGCFNKVAKPSDHAKGCPTGQNGSPNYN